MRQSTRNAFFLGAILLSATSYAHEGPGSCESSQDGCTSGVADDFYPVAAIRRGLDGKVTVNIEVDKSGHARDCRIVKSSGHTILDAAACRRFESLAHFRPGQDIHGNPVSSRVELTMEWELPETKSEVVLDR